MASPACTLPTLIAELENISSTEPFPMAAAGMLLKELNRAAADTAATHGEGMCTCRMCAAAAATKLERLQKPPQRYIRKGSNMALCRPMHEIEPMGADGLDTGNTKTITLLMDQPKGPASC
jgi:hypothetical protein